MNKEKIEGRKITLIGGAGFIGHNLALHLKFLGAEVSIIDSLQINNLAYFSSTSEEIVNRSLYLNILHERQRLLNAVNKTTQSTSTRKMSIPTGKVFQPRC